MNTINEIKILDGGISEYDFENLPEECLPTKERDFLWHSEQFAIQMKELKALYNKGCEINCINGGRFCTVKEEGRMFPKTFNINKAVFDAALLILKIKIKTTEVYLLSFFLF